MAQKDLMEFYEFLGKDENLRKRFRLIVQVLDKEGITSREIEDVKQNIIWLGREYGFYFTADEFIDSLKELRMVAYNSKIIPIEQANAEHIAGGRANTKNTLSTLMQAGLNSINMHNLVSDENIF